MPENHLRVHALATCGQQVYYLLNPKPKQNRTEQNIKYLLFFSVRSCSLHMLASLSYKVCKPVPWCVVSQSPVISVSPYDCSFQLTASCRCSHTRIRSWAICVSTRVRWAMSLKSWRKWNVTLSMTISFTCGSSRAQNNQLHLCSCAQNNQLHLCWMLTFCKCVTQTFI